MSALESAGVLKQQALHVLDVSKRGVAVQVDCNQLIDVCIALEDAAAGNYENIEFGRALAEAQVTAYRKIVNQIANLAAPDGEIWRLCHAEYDPEFTVDPDVVLAKIRS